MAKAPPGQIYVASRCAALPATSSPGRASADVREGQGGAGDGVRADRFEAASTIASRASHALPMVGRWAELATFAAKLDEALAGRGQIVGHLRRSGDGQVAPRRRIRADRRSKRGILVARRRVPVVRHEHQLPRLARNLGDAVWARRQPAEGEQVQALEARARERSTPRSCRGRRCSARLLDLPIPDNELTAHVRREAAQDVARGAAGRVPARARRAATAVCSCSRTATGSTRCRAICSRCSPARPPTSPCVLVLGLPSESGVGGGSASRACRTSTEIALAELDASKHAELDPLEARADAAAARPRLRPALVELITHPCAGQPVLHRGAPQLHPQTTASIRRTSAGAEAARAPREPPQPDPEPHRPLSEAPTPHAQGGERASGGCSGAPMLPGRLPGARRVRRSRGAASQILAPCDLVDVDPEAELTYLFKHVVTQEVAYESMPFAIRVDAARAGRRVHRDARARRDRAQPRPARPPLLAQREPAKKREYLRRAGDAAQAVYANAPRSTTSSAWRRCCEKGARVDVLLKLGKVLELVGDWHRAEAGRRRGARARRESRRRPRTRLVRDGARGGGAQAGPLRRGHRPPRIARRPVPRYSATRAARAGCCAPRRHRRGAAGRLREGGRELRGEPRDPRAHRRQGEHGQPADESRLSPSTAATTTLARIPRARARAAHRDRRPAGHRQLDEQPRQRRRPAEALRRGARLVPEVDAAQPRGRRRLDGRAVPPQPRQRDPRPGRRDIRRGGTTRTACARIATTTTGGRSRSCSRTSSRRRASTATAHVRSSSSAPPTRCAEQSARRARRRTTRRSEGELAGCVADWPSRTGSRTARGAGARLPPPRSTTGRVLRVGPPTAAPTPPADRRSGGTEPLGGTAGAADGCRKS